MGWMNQIGNLLESLLGRRNDCSSPRHSVNEDFNRVAQTAPQQNLGQAV